MPLSVRFTPLRYNTKVAAMVHFIRSPGGFWMICVCAIVVAIGAIVAFDDGYSHILTLDLDSATRVRIYEDSFCDRARIPCFEILQNGKLLSSRYRTELWLECGTPFLPHNFRVVHAENANLIGVVYDFSDRSVLAFAYDADSRTAIPNPVGQDTIPDSVRIKLLGDVAATEGGITK